MAVFAHMQEFVQAYAENIADVLGLDVTMLDENGVRISGTGYYRELVGEPAPDGSFFRMILKTGQPGMIYDMKKNEAECMSCKFLHQCKELATIGFPVFKRNKPVGVIGIIGFSAEQKDKMIRNSDKLIRFLHHMSTLLENKIISLESACQIQEETVPQRAVSFDSIVGKDSGLRDVIVKAKKVVNSISTVLIRGESGTGKELLARAIHYESSRRGYPFIAINCAAIPENLLESELFGYEGGAFTGAKREGNVGKFELAHRGTIFLDEIGDLPLPLQPKLLRVLQERSVDRIGGKQSMPIDVRVIAATNKNLEEMVGNGSFREDLYYRINVIPLYTKPLRECRGDIHLYLHFFLDKYCQLLGRPPLRIEPRLEQWLVEYDWPGNIRQLENAVEYMVNMAESDVIGQEDLPDYLLPPETRRPSCGNTGLEQMVSLYEKSVLERYLLSEKYQNDKALIADDLQISLSTLYRKLEKYKIG
ncbi:sigma-54 interaction domain-containing protein [Brevibacillus sp. B_LB10_24]|uniref:sigma-54 interaction domain-containing protein n=1 Tax=Brevibacillus sp. B_LB10_24 TaxID=3380645 RepID=UPI0038BB9422